MGGISLLLGHEGYDTSTSGRFYVVMTQSVLISGSELWVITTCIIQELESLHNQAEQNIYAPGALVHE